MVTSAKVHKNLLFRLQKDRNNVNITEKAAFPHEDAAHF